MRMIRLRFMYNNCTRPLLLILDFLNLDDSLLLHHPKPAVQVCLSGYRQSIGTYIPVYHGIDSVCAKTLTILPKR